MSEDATPTYRISAYTIYPTGYADVTHPDRRGWRLTVVNAGDGWSIRWRTKCLNFRGEWEFEPPPAARTPEFLRRCRYNEHVALYRARQCVDRLAVRGMTFEEFVREVHAEAMQQVQAERTRERQSKILKRVLGDINARMGSRK